MTSTKHHKPKDVIQIPDSPVELTPFTGYGQELQADPTISGVNERNDSIRYFNQYHNQIILNAGGTVANLFPVPLDKIFLINAISIACSGVGDAHAEVNFKDQSGNIPNALRVDSTNGSNAISMTFHVPVLIPSGWTIGTSGGGTHQDMFIHGWLEDFKNV